MYPLKARKARKFTPKKCPSMIYSNINEEEKVEQFEHSNKLRERSKCNFSMLVGEFLIR